MKSISRRSALTLAMSSGIASFGAGSASASPARNVDATLERLRHRVHGSSDLIRRAFGVLVFPTVIKAGIGIGAEYGEGALLVRGRTSGYYNIVSGSIGFQLGAQARSAVILFMTEEALAKFSRTDGWKVGVDGSVALITIGAGGSIDTDRITSPVVGFIFDGKGLMYNLTLEGTKISRMSGW
ncbi:MAG: YSC84-related protein [Hyphomicrobiaceae bacterium]